MRKILFAVVCLLLCGTAKAQNFVPIVSGVATVDASQGTNAQTSSFLIILTANVTSLEIIKPKTGQQITIILQQDSTGGRTVSCAADVLNCVTVTSTASSVTSQAFAYNSNTNKWSGLSGKSSAGSGTVTSVAETVPSWLTVAGSPVTTSGTLAVTPTTAQASGQVIGTCGAATTFAPCTLTSSDIPAPVVASVFTRVGAVTATSGDYTLDLIGSPAANTSFSLATFNLGVTAPGVFTSAAQNDQFLVKLTGGGTCSPLSILNGGGSTNKLTDAIAGCVNTPTSGNTNGFSNALAGYAQVNDTGTEGQFGFVGATGIYTNCQAVVNNAHCWGGNLSAADGSSTTGNSIIGNEIDQQINNNGTIGDGVLLSLRGNGQPTADNMPAVAIQIPSGTGKWTSGFECQNGSVYGSATNAFDCLDIGQRAAGNAQDSQFIFLHANSVTSSIKASFGLAQDNFIAFGSGVTSLIIDNSLGTEEGFGIGAKATATLAPNILVKIDTSNADSFVICTTSDTSCDGFVNATSGVYCAGGANFCPIITVPGSLAHGILGTGTCAIGNFVIVDTTTNGRVKCTGTPPTIGNVIGKAMSVQSSVGSLVDVLTKFE